MTPTSNIVQRLQSNVVEQQSNRNMAHFTLAHQIKSNPLHANTSPGKLVMEADIQSQTGIVENSLAAP